VGRAGNDIRMTTPPTKKFFRRIDVTRCSVLLLPDVRSCCVICKICKSIYSVCNRAVDIFFSVQKSEEQNCETIQLTLLYVVLATTAAVLSFCKSGRRYCFYI
jgi:hypothetical protein